MDIHGELERRFLLQEEYLGTDKPVNRSIPLVSVKIATYQHAPFIRQCLDSIVMQKTNFSFELILGEDASTDGTREICIEYAERYPDIIRLFLRDRALSQYIVDGVVISRFNSRWNTMSCRGKYIASCEGDDSWLNPDKLQMQVDFLEANPDYSMCCGGFVKRHSVSGEEEIVVYERPPSDEGFTFTLDGMRDQWFTKTLTTVFRRDATDTRTFSRYRYGRDIHFFYHLLSAGKGYYFSLPLGIYNIHPGGVNSMQQGQVNANAAYNCYKELYEYNGDDFTREMARNATLALLNYDLYNTYSQNTPKRKANLIKEALQFVGSLRELKMFISAFIPRSVKDRVTTPAA
ncbi:MAG: glycosyltransferase [Flavobacterium sp.]|nr:glycosyltransferase [Flavobacterium sp.]